MKINTKFLFKKLQIIACNNFYVNIKRISINELEWKHIGELRNRARSKKYSYENSGGVSRDIPELETRG